MQPTNFASPEVVLMG